jgi:hypothetical protein
LLGLQAQLAAFARVQHPVVEGAHLRQVAAPPRAHGPCEHGHVAARLAQVQLVEQPVTHGGLVAQQAVLDGALQALGIRKAAHGQRGRGEPD